jgi:hypothetical protein
MDTATVTIETKKRKTIDEVLEQLNTMPVELSLNDVD